MKYVFVTNAERYGENRTKIHKQANFEWEEDGDALLALRKYADFVFEFYDRLTVHAWKVIDGKEVLIGAEERIDDKVEQEDLVCCEFTGTWLAGPVTAEKYAEAFRKQAEKHDE